MALGNDAVKNSQQMEWCCEIHGQIPKDQKVLFHDEVEQNSQPKQYSQSPKNEKRRFQNARICLGCGVVFTGKGSVQRAREHRTLTSHPIDRRSKDSVTE